MFNNHLSDNIFENDNNLIYSCHSKDNDECSNDSKNILLNRKTKPLSLEITLQQSKENNDREINNDNDNEIYNSLDNNIIKKDLKEDYVICKEIEYSVKGCKKIKVEKGTQTKKIYNNVDS